MTVVVHNGHRVCDLEVSTEHAGGRICHLDGWGRAVTHPPASGEWWFVDDLGVDRAIVTRSSALGERYDLDVAGTKLRVEPVGRRWWRRQWSVRDADDREVVTVTQRLFTRPVHDVEPRAGDLPEDLVWVVAWLLAERLSRGQSVTRRPRWGTPTA